jgi:4-hydroxybenzoate polyprenyltransferase
MKAVELLRAYLWTSRGEYLVAEVPALFTLFFLGASSFGRFLAPEVLEAIAVFVLLFFFGFMINAYTDQELDSRYTIFKNRIPGAVRAIGQRNFRILMAAQVAAAFCLTAHISYIMQSWVPMLLALVGVFFGAGYSLPPLHFKVRGWLHPVSLSLSIFFIPPAFMVYTIAGHLTPEMLLFLAGVSVLHYGIEIANQAIDYNEDLAAGVGSPPVRWGLQNSLILGLACVAAGGLLELSGLYLLALGRAGAAGSLLGLAAWQFFLLAVPIVLCGYLLPVRGLWRMYRASVTRPVAEATSYMKGICTYSLWQASGIMGLMVVAGLMFLSGRPA